MQSERTGHTGAMRTIATVAAFAALLAAGAAWAAPASREATAALRVTSTYPLTVRGAAFKPRERVTLTVVVTASKERRVRKVTAGRLGGFTTTFTTLIVDDRCEITATAVGARGSRATFKVPQRQCRPRP
jgi:hypothetical protein